MSIIALLKFVLSHPLNSAEKGAALGRVWRWQVASRLIDAPVALPFVEGTSLLVRTGMTGATGNWYCGLHELPEMAFVLHVLRETDLFVDVGANIGSYSVLAGGAVGARVIAVEPVPETAKALAQNVALNGISDRCRVRQVGIAKRNGQLRFTSSLDTVNHVVEGDERGGVIEVPVLTLDDMLQGEVPTLMKIDVEGYELAVLEGGLQTLMSPDLVAVIMETNGSGERYGIDDARVFDLMERCGFVRMVYDPFSRLLVNQTGGLQAGSQNSIFVKDPDRVRERLQKAKKYRLVNGSI